jgi:hypothetical protein
MPILVSLMLAVAAALIFLLMSLRSRWSSSSWHNDQITPVREIDELVRIVSGLYRRALRRGDPRSTTITQWVEPFRPMMSEWVRLKSELQRNASFTHWLRVGMPRHLEPDHRVATLELHARSAVAPVLSRFNSGPVELGPALADDLWRAFSFDLPEATPTQTSVSPRLS